LNTAEGSMVFVVSTYFVGFMVVRFFELGEYVSKKSELINMDLPADTAPTTQRFTLESMMKIWLWERNKK
jgi:hypothetical protein